MLTVHAIMPPKSQPGIDIRSRFGASLVAFADLHARVSKEDLRPIAVYVRKYEIIAKPSTRRSENRGRPPERLVQTAMMLGNRGTHVCPGQVRTIVAYLHIRPLISR